MRPSSFYAHMVIKDIKDIAEYIVKEIKKKDGDDS